MADANQLNGHPPNRPTMAVHATAPAGIVSIDSVCPVEAIFASRHNEAPV
jgi:hypothetical protein